MVLSNIERLFTRCEPVKYAATCHDSFERIDEPVFYVTPEFGSITESKQPRFLLFSATGAAGKSTLAKYLAQTYNGVYWNLARIILGEGTLHGSLLRAVGYENYSSFISNLNSGHALLIIDAFDEADIISGRAGIDFLLNDLNDLTANSTACSIVLLARTETALHLSEYCENHNILFSHYEIGLFSEYYSKEFIREKISQAGHPITDVVDQCINQQIAQLRRLLGTDTLLESFIGYAPILEALAAAYDEERNIARFLESLKTGANSSTIITEILGYLLERERKKVVQALTERWSKKFPEFDDWDAIYVSEEQLVHLVSFIIFGEVDFSMYENKQIPASMYDDYVTAIESFVPQHPFVRNFCKIGGQNAWDFTGPAFRDYALAFVLSSETYADYATEYFENHQSASHCPSQLFFDFYIKFTGNKVVSIYLPYLYDSFKARETAKSISKITISGTGDYGTAVFALDSNGTNDEEYILNVVVRDQCYCFRNLTNADIDVDCKAVIGDQRNGTRLYNTTIICNQLVWNTSNVLLEGRTPGYSMIVCHNNPVSMDGRNVVFNIQIDAPECLRISYPQIKCSYKLRQYAFDYDDCSNDSDKALHAIRKITGCLRKHSKDAAARDKEFIDFVIVGQSAFTKSILAFLLDTDVIFVDSAESHLYKLNSQRSAALGISWGLSASAATAGERVLYEYREWKKCHRPNCE